MFGIFWVSLYHLEYDLRGLEADMLLWCVTLKSCIPVCTQEALSIVGLKNLIIEIYFYFYTVFVPIVAPQDYLNSGEQRRICWEE